MISEKDGDITKDLWVTFINDISGWFSDDDKHQKIISDYLVACTLQYREQCRTKYREQCLTISGPSGIGDDNEPG